MASHKKFFFKLLWIIIPFLVSGIVSTFDGTFYQSVNSVLNFKAMFLIAVLFLCLFISSIIYFKSESNSKSFDTINPSRVLQNLSDREKDILNSYITNDKTRQILAVAPYESPIHGLINKDILSLGAESPEPPYHYYIKSEVFYYLMDHRNLLD